VDVQGNVDGHLDDLSMEAKIPPERPSFWQGGHQPKSCDEPFDVSD